MLDWLKTLLGIGPNHKDILAKGALIIDVRTPAEFKQGHVKGSTNIPLNSLSGQLKKLQKQNKPILVCCRSGSRSGYAARYLRAEGLEAYNAGPWQRVRKLLSELKFAASEP